jgi:flagellar biosynthesis/type III secretory pathway protein FliH
MSAATPFNRPVVAALAGIESSRRVIPAADVAELERIASAAVAPTQRIEAAEVKAREGLGRVVHAAWQRGFVRGHVEALDRLRDFLAALSERRKGVDAELVGLVADAVTRIVRALPAEMLTESLIQAALDEAAGERGRVVLRVHPARMTVVETWLRHRPAPPAEALSIVVEADSAVGLDDCTLETSNGVIETGLAIQLQALRTTLFAAT